MKVGANKTDQAKIRKMALGIKGTNEVDEVKPMSAASISKRLGIELDVVKSFMPKKEKKTEN